MYFPSPGEAPNILHSPFDGSRPPTQLTNPSHKSQLSRAIDYVSSERESGVTPVEWMEGWYATPFMGAIFPCGKDIHHEMFSRLWNAWKWINRQMALHPCNRPEILLAHVFVQDIIQIRGKFQKLSFSFKVDWRKGRYLNEIFVHHIWCHTIFFPNDLQSEIASLGTYCAWFKQGD